LSQSTHLKDEQTDRRTDRILITTPCLHSMQYGKKPISTNDELQKYKTHVKSPQELQN